MTDTALHQNGMGESPCPGDDGVVAYFAYGSNLDADDLRRHCDARSAAYPLARCLGPAALPGYQLVFDRYSVRRRGGVLNVRPAVGAAVAGVVFDVDAAGMALLDAKEGRNYARAPVEVRFADGGAPCAAVTYVGVGGAGDLLKPSEAYHAVVARGYAAHGLELAPLERARAEAEAATIDHLFVYGTLLSGEVNHEEVARLGPLCVREVALPGTLYDLGAYPGLSLAPSAALVRGELVQFRDITRALRELDRFEGYEGPGERWNLYDRVAVEVALGAARVRAWTYVFAGARERAPVIATGDWRLVRRSR